MRKMEEIGVMLRAAREELSVTMEDLYERTKIKMRFLEAIEEGRFSEVPGEAYLRGFLKLYAQEVGLDPKEILKRYEKGTKGKKRDSSLAVPLTRQELRMKRRVKRKRQRLRAALFLILLLFVLWYVLRS